jgi:hemoglobin
MFDRWLDLWQATTAEVMAPADAAALQSRAARIAVVLRAAIFDAAGTGQ